MRLETNDHGKVNAALTTGIIGTAGVALAALGGGNGCGNNGGLLGGLLGGNNHNCYVTEKEQAYATALAIAQSEKYTAQESRSNLEALYAEVLRLNTIQRETDAKIADGLIQTGTAVGNLTARVDCLDQSVQRNREEGFRNLAEAKTYTDTRVDAEANLRKCEDEKVILWTKAQNYVPAVLRVDPDQICGASPLSSGCCG